MLIFIFGVWLNTAQVSYLGMYKEGCYLNFSYSTEVFFKNKTCDQVAAEINKAVTK